ncbi:MAG: hypothetical protein AAF799_23365 [Myxococcota bacterium]
MALSALGSLALAAGAFVSTPSPPAQATTPTPTVVAPSHQPQLDPPPVHRFPGKKLSNSAIKRKRGFLIGGGVLFGLAYLGGTLTAAVMIDKRIEDGVLQLSERSAMRAAKLMLIPGLGPMAAAGVCKCGGFTVALVNFGFMQAMGMAYMTVGAVPLLRHRRAMRLRLAAAPTRGGGTLALHGRF